MTGRPKFTLAQERDRRRLTGELNGTGAAPADQWGISAEEFGRIVREVEEERAKR